MAKKVPKQYNTTQLPVDKVFKRLVFHRDYLAHYFRWTHALKFLVQRSGLVLDVGCGDCNLLRVAYHNRTALKAYVGIDYRAQTLKAVEDAIHDASNKEGNDMAFTSRPNFPVFFSKVDIVNEPAPTIEKITQTMSGDYDLVACFEVFEHVGKKNGPAMLDNIKAAMGPSTVFMLSTPCFNGKAANNHVINGEVGEWGYEELKELLEKKFTIANHYGTFASQADIDAAVAQNPDPIELSVALNLYDRLREYYDSNLASILFAPLFPQASRNCLWVLTR